MASSEILLRNGGLGLQIEDVRPQTKSPWAPWAPWDQGPGTTGQGPGTRGQGPGARDQGPGTRDQGPGTRDQGPQNANRFLPGPMPGGQASGILCWAKLLRLGALLLRLGALLLRLWALLLRPGFALRAQDRPESQENKVRIQQGPQGPSD